MRAPKRSEYRTAFVSCGSMHACVHVRVRVKETDRERERKRREKQKACTYVLSLSRMRETERERERRRNGIVHDRAYRVCNLCDCDISLSWTRVRMRRVSRYRGVFLAPIKKTIIDSGRWGRGGDFPMNFLTVFRSRGQ